MSAQPITLRPPGHPASVAVRVHEALDELGPVDTLSPGEYARVVAEFARARERLRAVELKLVAAADRAKVPTQAGARSTASWVAAQTRVDQASAARDTRLALDLATRLPVAAAALDSGWVSAAHAQVIAEAMRKLPRELDSGQRDQVEASLTEHARRVDPATLRRRARRALASVESDQAKVDAHENNLLVDEEARARAKTRLTLHDNNDGTTTGHFTVPTLAASMLKKVLDAMTSPRRGRPGASRAHAGDPILDRDPAHERGLAFGQLLEHIPTDHLHSKVAATIIVKLDHDHLADQLKAAGLDTGDLVSAGEARRLACQAGILPAVLSGADVPINLGRTQRLFSQAQRLAGATRWTTCAADGCDIPYAWVELHHETPWSRGGQTDYNQLLPLCGFHHHRIHDRAFDHRRLPDGSVRFTRRT